MFILLFLFSVLASYAQRAFPPLSAPSQIEVTVGFTKISIKYDRPSARGRQIFGGLVPFHEVWRTGGGRNTLITFSTPVAIARQRVPAGEYNLLSIPGKEQWSFILNQDTSLWGTYNYDSSKNVIEFDVLVEKQSIYMETMTLAIDVVPYDAVLHFMWENVHVKFPIQTGTNEQIEAFIQDSLLTNFSKNSEDYFNAAHHLYMLQEDDKLALELISKSLELEETAYGIGQKAEILFKLDRVAEAIEVANQGYQWELDHDMDGLYFKKMMERFEKD